ncbi:hypothetical protein ACOME3_010834, partial [Neoechinorhynchus agilis]
DPLASSLNVQITIENIKRAGVLGHDNKVYILGDLIGEGSFGQVLKCKQKGSKSNLAVKILKNAIGDFDMDDCEVKMFKALKEADGERANIAVPLEMFK